MRSIILVAGLVLLAACQAPVATPEPEARLPTPPSAPAQVQVNETPCRQAIGEAASARLVQRCIAVSPATRPPGNAANPCDLIQSEIDRSCAQYSANGKPVECAG